MPEIHTYETYKFTLALVRMCGGHATCVPVDCRMSGGLESTTGKAWTPNVLSVPTEVFATTTRC